jgi:TM2 domain-containing membrane protein YozV
VQTTQTFQQPVVVKEDKNPIISAVLSFFFPGAGQAYNGQTLKGAGFFIGMLITSFIPILPIIVWIYGLYDSYTTANKMNKGEIPYIASSTGGVIGIIVLWILIVVLMIIGVIAMLGSGMSY